MKRLVIAIAASAGLLLSAAPGWAQVDKLYILDCGHAHAPDQARWSPGVNVGVPIDISDNCYLIHHAQGYLLWDTGLTDKLADMTEVAPGPLPWRRPKKLIAQLAALGVTPADIKYVAVSHTHPDHVGNVDLFPQSMLLIQQAEWDWHFATPNTVFKPDRPVTKLNGNYDVFGDGSVRIISTPGHTPGHESLLVDLPKTGYVLLSGDAVHFKSNWENRRVPAGNTDTAATLASMQHIAELLAQYHAQLWINHDQAQSDTLKYAPEFYD
jgi:glyoxylase-like metal-dependent hydrolase (beta-lactamase superfamily II)